MGRSTYIRGREIRNEQVKLPYHRLEIRPQWTTYIEKQQRNNIIHNIRKYKTAFTTIIYGRCNAMLRSYITNYWKKSCSHETIKKKVNTLSRMIASIHLRHHYAHIFQQCKVNPKLNYSLAATSMSHAQINSIHHINHPKVIASKGYNRKWPRELRYGYHQYCGLGLQDYRVEQRLRKIQITHKLLNHPKHVILIQSIISYYHLSVGTTKQVLEYQTDWIYYISSIWFRDLLHFMYRKKKKIDKNILVSNCKEEMINVQWMKWFNQV